MMRYGFGMGWFGAGVLAHIISAVFALVVIVLLVVLFVALMRNIHHAGRQAHASQPPAAAAPAENAALKILNERFARGEINEEEYTKKKELILKQ